MILPKGGCVEYRIGDGIEETDVERRAAGTDGHPRSHTEPLSLNGFEIITAHAARKTDDAGRRVGRSTGKVLRDHRLTAVRADQQVAPKSRAIGEDRHRGTVVDVGDLFEGAPQP